MSLGIELTIPLSLLLFDGIIFLNSALCPPIKMNELISTEKLVQEAKRKGVDFSCGWWMREGRVNLKDGKFNYTGWYMNMKNRFGWKDKTEVDNSIKGDITIIRKVIDGRNED